MQTRGGHNINLFLFTFLPSPHALQLILHGNKILAGGDNPEYNFT